MKPMTLVMLTFLVSFLAGMAVGLIGTTKIEPAPLVPLEAITVTLAIPSEGLSTELVCARRPVSPATTKKVIPR